MQNLLLKDCTGALGGAQGRTARARIGRDLGRRCAYRLAEDSERRLWQFAGTDRQIRGQAGLGTGAQEALYQPVLQRIEPLLIRKEKAGQNISPAELYFQVLEHKWYLSERAKRDVGHMAAVADFLQRFD